MDRPEHRRSLTCDEKTPSVRTRMLRSIRTVARSIKTLPLTARTNLDPNPNPNSRPEPPEPAQEPLLGRTSSQTPPPSGTARFSFPIVGEGTLSVPSSANHVPRPLTPRPPPTPPNTPVTHPCSQPPALGLSALPQITSNIRSVSRNVEPPTLRTLYDREQRALSECSSPSHHRSSSSSALAAKRHSVCSPRFATPGVTV